MKPLLIIVLAIALIAAILLGVVIIKNKNTEKNEVIFQSDFGVSNTTAWARNGVDNVEYLQEADGYFARVKSSENNQTASLISEPFALEPDAEYELSFYLRIPDESEAFINGEKYIAPAICLYQTEINENGSTVSSAAKVSATTNNIYAYNGVRRDDFSAVWQIEGFEPYPVTGLSILTSDHQYDILGIDTDLKTAYSSWKKITAKFTGVADADNTYPQMVAVSFGYSALPKNGYIFDVKKVELIKMANETTVEPDPESFVYYQDFEDEDALESAVEFLGNEASAESSLTKKEAKTGGKSCAIYGVQQPVFIPFDKEKLSAEVVYSFSMDWKMLKYTEDKNRKVENVFFVGFNPADGEFLDNYNPIAGVGVRNATGRWENAHFNLKITEANYKKYEQFGIYISYKSSGEYSKDEDTLFVDAVTLKEAENQSLITPLLLDEEPRKKDTVKVLAIGNSFSNDGTSFIPQIAKADGADLRVGDCSIGGCSLKKHYNNSITNSNSYSFNYRKPDGTQYLANVSLIEALTATDWDYITIQQVSTLSGLPNTYEPYLKVLLNKFKEYCPNAKVLFHMTWSYKDGLEKEGYEAYENSQTKMYNAIKSTYAQYSEKYGSVPIVPSGETIKILREQISDTLFNGEKENSFTRDGFHLSEKGRVAAAFTWYEIFTGISAVDTKIDLSEAIGTTKEDAGNIGITEAEGVAIKKAAHQAVESYKKAN